MENIFHWQGSDLLFGSSFIEFNTFKNAIMEVVGGIWSLFDSWFVCVFTYNPKKQNRPPCKWMKSCKPETEDHYRTITVCCESFQIHCWSWNTCVSIKDSSNAGHTTSNLNQILNTEMPARILRRSERTGIRRSYTMSQLGLNAPVLGDISYTVSQLGLNALVGGISYTVSQLCLNALVLGNISYTVSQLGPNALV